MKEHPNTNIKSGTATKRCKVACIKHGAMRRFIGNNKRGYSTEGSTLLPSVLRPRLFGIGKDKEGKFFNVSFGKNITKENPDEVRYEFSLNLRLGLLSLVVICLGIAAINVINVSAVSATLSVPDSVSVNANPTTNNGFAESSNGAISVSTGNQMGYTLTIKAKDNNQLKNGSNVLNSISTNLTADQYKNGDYVNTWGMKPSSINSADNTSYIPGPNTSGVTLASTHASSNDAENYSLGIAAKVDSNTIAGNYTNTFTISATANEARYNITYNLNGGSGGPGNITESNAIGSLTEIPINDKTPTAPSGKDFLGWCSKNPGEGDTCDGVLVQPGKSLYLCKCDLNITLYAMYGTKPKAEGDFSGMSNGADCQYKNYSGKVYGGLCWMWSDLKTQRSLPQATSDCTEIGWRLPTQAEFEDLISDSNMGSGGNLYDQGWLDYYWSSTLMDKSRSWHLQVYDSGASVGKTNFTTNSVHSVRCVTG